MYGKCPTCHQFGTMTKSIQTDSKNLAPRHWSAANNPTPPQRLSEVQPHDELRHPLNIKELNRVLGGGIVPGSILLLGGEPGIGKSTLLSQMAADIADSLGTVFYVSGEESAAQVKLRAKRLGLDSENLYLMTETLLENILDQAQNLNPKVLIVDSIQTTYTYTLDNAPGNPTQIRECAGRLQAFAKNTGTTVFLVGHVTKTGDVAGPKLLEHLVDTVLYLEGDPFHLFRLLRTAKNRFGSTNEVGVFEMQNHGLIEVSNPSAAFLSERPLHVPGSAITVTMEGSRPLLVEVQALNNQAPFSNPRRTSNGIDANRMLLTNAVLTRRCQLALMNHDVFINVVGGLKIAEPAADLAIALALTSSFFNQALPADAVMIGEIGLSGELRPVASMAERLNEAIKLGFKQAIIPMHKSTKDLPQGLKITQASRLNDAIQAMLPKTKRQF